jgi:hypothetical protein
MGSGFLLTRRAVLASGALLPLAPVFGSGLRPETNRNFDPSAAIIIDEVCLHADAVARHASLRAHVHWLKPDLSQLYFHELAPQWHARGVRPLIGFTRAGPAYILEQLALEFGQRLVHAQKLEPAANVSRDEWLAEVLDRLLLSPISRKPLANRDLIREAMLAEDPALFAWCLAPVRQSILTPNRAVTV